MTSAQIILAPVFIVACLSYGLAAAILPGALVKVAIEHHQPHRLWRVLGWALVALAFVTPSAFALAAILSH
jgi:hypothetical protein